MGQAISDLIWPRRLKILVLPGSFSNEASWTYLIEELPNVLAKDADGAEDWLAKLGDIVEFIVCLPSASHESAPFASGTEEMDKYFHEKNFRPKQMLEILKIKEDDTFDWWNMSIDAIPIEGRDLPSGMELPSEKIDSALKHVRQFVEGKGPFHGVLGFSQGAALAQLLLTGADSNMPEFNFATQFRFAVMVSAFNLPPFTKFRSAVPPKEPLKIPAYCIAGARDYCKESCEKLARETFGLSGLSELHGGDHTIGFSPSAALRAFLQDQWNKEYSLDGTERGCCKRRPSR